MLFFSTSPHQLFVRINCTRKVDYLISSDDSNCCMCGISRLFRCFFYFDLKVGVAPAHCPPPPPMDPSLMEYFVKLYVWLGGRNCCGYGIFFPCFSAFWKLLVYLREKGGGSTCLNSCSLMSQKSSTHWPFLVTTFLNI